MSVWPLMVGLVLLSMKTTEAAVNGVVLCALHQNYGIQIGTPAGQSGSRRPVQKETRPPLRQASRVRREGGGQ